MEKQMTYTLLGLGVILLGWVAYSALQLPDEKLENNAANFQYYQQQAAGSECGDINSLQNIQHLSHHPDRFKDCYRYIDPQKFREATGQDINSYLG